MPSFGHTWSPPLALWQYSFCSGCAYCRTNWIPEKMYLFKTNGLERIFRKFVNFSKFSLQHIKLCYRFKECLRYSNLTLPGQVLFDLLAWVRVAQMRIEVLIEHFRCLFAKIAPLSSEIIK